MQIAMIGSGYVGLVSGACLADLGHNVICVDKDADKIAKLQACKIPIYEPGLEKLVKDNMAAGHLRFTTDLPDAVKAADAVFIAVGTPTRRGDGHADLRYVFEVAQEIAFALARYTVVVNKSTVPVGTGKRVEEIIRELNADAEFDVVSNPEFLREGSAIEDFTKPDRVVVGCTSDRARAVMREIYRPLVSDEKLLLTTRESSELIKYAANAFLATKITFINEMADLCEKAGADVESVARGIGMDSRIGHRFLHAGPGYGGSCFPKDTLALLQTAKDFNTRSRIVEAVVEVNNARKAAMADKIVQAFGGDVKGKTIAILGLAFKPDTDDMRDAPSLVILPALAKAGAHIRACDPEAVKEARTNESIKDLKIDFRNDAYDAIDGADGVVILTEWKIFRALDLPRVKALLKAPLMIDLRNVYRPEHMKAAGFRYISIGRADVV